MAKVPLFGIGNQGKSPVVTAKTLQNFFIEYRPAGETCHVVGHGFPGHDLFIDFGGTPSRGLLSVDQNSLLYVAHRGVLWDVNNAGVKTSRGTFSTVTGSMGFATDGLKVVIVDGTYGYVYTIATTTLVQITDIDFPANPTSVTWQDGYFIVGFDNGSFYISTDGTSWDALDFASAESNPDRLIRVFADHGELILFGDVSTEFWGNTGALDFPFAKIKGADVEWGLAARDSVTKFADSVAFLCKNRLGEVIVGKLVGHAVDPISTPDMDTTINGYSVTSDATAFSYLLGGHPMYQINFPSAGYSWSYDGLSNQWSSRKSYGITRHRAEFGTQYLSRTIVTDYASGKLYRINKDTFTENGESIEGEIVGEHMNNELSTFIIDLIRIDIEAGVGTTEGQGAVPQIMLQISDDGGKSWSSEMYRDFGALGNFKEVPEWDRLGPYERATIKMRITDPVKRTVMGCYVNPPR